MDFGASKTPIEVIREGAKVLILETFILIVESGTENRGKNLIS